MSIQAQRFKPEAIVSFSTETGDLVMRTKPDSEGYSIDDSILSIQTDNDLSADAATFQITLAPFKKWDKILASNDFVRIRMARRAAETDEKVGTVMAGLIDDVRPSVSIQNGTPQRVITVTGRSFAKALINFEIGVVQEMSLSLNAGWLLNSGITFNQESASSIVRQVLDNLVYKYMNYKFHNGKDFKSLIDTKLSSRPGEKLFDQTSFINYQGSIWSFIREIVNEPFNQVFWECYEKPTLVVRETPFNPANWNDLPIHEITDADVVVDSFGRSDIETYSLFSVGMQSFFGSFDINKTTGVFPYWYEPYFKKYGLRRLNRFTAYVGYTSSEDSEDVHDQLLSYQQDLYNWNIHNPSFLNGYITVRGECKYKIGDRLLYKSDEHGEQYEFFIEGVSHEFVTGQYWITRLTVTRGLPEAGAKRFESPWGTYSTYDPTALGAPALPGDFNGIDTGSADGYYPGIPFDSNASPLAKSVLNTAYSYIGKVTYRMGAGRSERDISRNYFDCSSFVYHVFNLNGVTLGSRGSVTTDTLARQGHAVNLSQIKSGDLIFFNTYKHNGHVGIYAGDGKFIGAQESGVNTQDVQWWIKHYGLGSIRRVI